MNSYGSAGEVLEEEPRSQRLEEENP